LKSSSFNLARLIELHIGQGEDIWWRDNHICPTEENYCQMVIRKCGGLFQMALDLLKICSSIELHEETNKAINDLCKNLGLLFQIRDDYCNLVSNEYALSKSYCEDLSEGKYSFPVIHAIQSRPNDTRIRNVLKKRTNNDSLKREIVRLLHEFGSIEYTKNKCIKLADECQALIDKLEAGVQFQVILNQLTAIFDELAQNGTN
jgi:geranylgeranyl diphosphate synthase type 3